jgi:hypothetical protein
VLQYVVIVDLLYENSVSHCSLHYLFHRECPIWGKISRITRFQNVLWQQFNFLQCCQEAEISAAKHKRGQKNAEANFCQIYKKGPKKA